MAPSEDPIIIVPYQARWPAEFVRIGAELRETLGLVAIRIDHVGSTAVPGLAGKDVIDLQISVADLDTASGTLAPLGWLGYLYQASNPDRTKRMYREPPGRRRTHIHIRRSGSFDEQLNLLFRDFLRENAAAAEVYAAEKRTLAERFRDDRTGYVGAKEPIVWGLLVQAHSWAQARGWSPPASDA